MNVGKVILDVLFSCLTQLLLWVGGPVFIGFLVAIGNHVFYKCLSAKSFYPVSVMTGALGTPIHEFGHAIFALIFGFRITEMVLFDPVRHVTEVNGVRRISIRFGYVKHAPYYPYYSPKKIKRMLVKKKKKEAEYAERQREKEAKESSENTKNGGVAIIKLYTPYDPYQRVGAFFIAVGPIILISAVILLLERIFVKDMFFLTSAIQAAISEDAGDGNVLWGLILYVGKFFSAENLKNVFWWVYVLLSCTICMHMNLSGEDVETGKRGVLSAAIVFFVLPLTFVLMDPINFTVFHTANNIMTVAGVYFFGTMIISTLFVFLMDIIALTTKGIVRLVTAIAQRVKKDDKKASSKKKKKKNAK